MVETELDERARPDVRETVREVALRADLVLSRLLDTRARTILCISHGVLLEMLLNRCSLAVCSAAREARFANCELRSLVIAAYSPFPPPAPAPLPPPPPAAPLPPPPPPPPATSTPRAEREPPAAPGAAALFAAQPPEAPGAAMP
jgi:hypothetical protein